MKSSIINIPTTLLQRICKIILMINIIAISTITLSAQDHSAIEFEKGGKDLSIGLGLMPSFIDRNTSPLLPPISMVFTYKFKKHLVKGSIFKYTRYLAVSTYFGYSSTEYKMPEEETLKLPVTSITMRNNFFVAGLRGEGHFIRDRMDFYGGGMIGYSFSNNKNVQRDDSGMIENRTYADKITWSALFGVKYLMKPSIGIYGEICYGVSLFNVGVTFKL